MVDPRIQKLAQVLVQYSTDVKPGESVAISSPLAALPLAREVYREVLRAGANPTVNFADEEMGEIFLQEANDEQLRHIPAPRRIIADSYQVQISLIAPTNTRYLSNVDPAR